MKWEKYKNNIKNALDNFVFDEKIPYILSESIYNKQKIFIAGNGGSASLASHYQNDFSKGAVCDWINNKNRYQVHNLTSDIGYITAIANDLSYDDIFKQQLINVAKKKDILILISSSGNSRNIVTAAHYGKLIGMTVIGITGFSGGSLRTLADYNAYLKENSYEVVEDIHAIFGHFLTMCMKENNK